MTDDESLLEKVTSKKDFIQSVFVDDASCDWALARQFGEYLVRIEGEFFLGHLISIRALRHLGEREAAILQLDVCKEAIKTQTRIGLKEELLGMVRVEESLLRGSNEKEGDFNSPH
jgi:hypothetical protein